MCKTCGTNGPLFYPTLLVYMDFSENMVPPNLIRLIVTFAHFHGRVLGRSPMFRHPPTLLFLYIPNCISGINKFPEQFPLYPQGLIIKCIYLKCLKRAHIDARQQLGEKEELLQAALEAKANGSIGSTWGS